MIDVLLTLAFLAATPTDETAPPPPPPESGAPAPVEPPAPEPAPEAAPATDTAPITDEVAPVEGPATPAETPPATTGPSPAPSTSSATPASSSGGFSLPALSLYRHTTSVVAMGDGFVFQPALLPEARLSIPWGRFQLDMLEFTTDDFGFGLYYGATTLALAGIIPGIIGVVGLVAGDPLLSSGLIVAFGPLVGAPGSWFTVDLGPSMQYGPFLFAVGAHAGLESVPDTVRWRTDNATGFGFAAGGTALVATGLAPSITVGSKTRAGLVFGADREVEALPRLDTDLFAYWDSGLESFIFNWGAYAAVGLLAGPLSDGFYALPRIHVGISY